MSFLSVKDAKVLATHTTNAPTTSSWVGLSPNRKPHLPTPSTTNPKTGRSYRIKLSRHNKAEAKETPGEYHREREDPAVAETGLMAEVMENMDVEAISKAAVTTTSLN
ncbi:hypothetical protein H0H93_009969 [Arthromyces matolae]|nr:hypothetical protein H0H93_009969 [Arthromyces matolae]